MKTADMRDSQFLKQTDVGDGAVLTITGIEQRNVAMEGAKPEMKFVMTFAESDKPLVLNTTNIQMCEKIFGSDETDDWAGKKVVLYTDPNVSYGGKLVGGIRVRATKQGATSRPSALPAEDAEPDFGPDVDEELEPGWNDGPETPDAVTVKKFRRAASKPGAPRPWTCGFAVFSDNREGASFDAAVIDLLEAALMNHKPVLVTMEVNKKDKTKLDILAAGYADEVVL